MSDQFILASQSPRRKALLTQMGYFFECHAANIDESILNDEIAEHYVSRLAVKKAQHVSRQKERDTIVLGADTCVVLQGKILGKPATLKECQDTLSLLSDTTHEVLTSVAVIRNDIITAKLVKTAVDFKPLTSEEIKQYWLTGEPQDKAGAYGIQGLGGQFVKKIRGSYSAVVGLPLFETTQLLTEFGIYGKLQNIIKE